MNRPIRILFLEDNRNDVELVERELNMLGFKYILKHVEDQAGFRKALDEFTPDLILSDYNLPQFNGMEALRIARVQAPSVPFIVVTGSINEATAVACIKSGALDYVLKDHLPRLVIAIKEALDLKQTREERMRAEEALKESEKKYRKLFDDALDMIHLVNSKGRIVDVNKIELEKLGYAKEELLGKNLLDIIHSDYRDKTKKAIGNALKGEMIEVYETVLVSKKGKSFDVEMNAFPQIEGEKIVGVRAIIRDITERKNTERELEKHRNHLEELVSKRTEELEQSENRFRAIARTAHDAIIMMDNKGFISFWNPAAEKMFGYSKKEAIGKGLHVFLAPKRYHDAYRKGMKTFKREGKGPVIGKTLELEAVRKNKQEVPIELSVSGLEIKGKTHVVGIIRDITVRKKSERRLHDLIRNIKAGIVVHASDTKILDSNQTAQDLLGLTENQMSGKKAVDPAWRFVREDGSHMPVEEYPVNVVLKEKRILQDYIIGIDRPDKEKITYLLVNAVPDFDKNSDIAQVFVTFMDISERMKLQEELVRKNKLALLGQLAGGVAHELRNPLGTIKNVSYFLNMSLEKPDEEVKEMLQVLGEEIELTSNTIDRLLDFARPSASGFEKVDLNNIVNKALSHVNCQEEIKVEVCFDSDIPSILADPHQLERAFENIVRNAVQAMAEGGKLSIKTELTASDKVRVSFSDTGIGIPEDNLEKLFEPLYTTKAKGIGLGLALCKLFVERNQGTIEVKSEEEKGSTFIIDLPASVTSKEKHG